MHHRRAKREKERETVLCMSNTWESLSVLKDFVQHEVSCNSIIEMYSTNFHSSFFLTDRTRNARLWIHLSFLDLQSRSEDALSSFDSSVASLKHCWDILKLDNRTFITLVTSAFPSVRDQEMMRVELGHSGFFDVFDLSPPDSSVDQLNYNWGCFL